MEIKLLMKILLHLRNGKAIFGRGTSQEKDSIPKPKKFHIKDSFMEVSLLERESYHNKVLR